MFKKENVMTKLQEQAKIEKLPQNITETIPFRGMLANGIVETYPGTFTKSYRLKDINFTIAQPEEQATIFSHYMELLNTFDESMKWQINIFNHKTDKRDTIENLRILPQQDGLNKYRQEMNKVLLNNLTQGNNSITQEKFLTVAIDDDNVEHAVSTLRRVDVEVSNALKKICKQDTFPMSSLERMRLLYDIYNQESDYRFATGILDGEEEFSLEHIEKLGLSIKDVVGPAGINFAPRDYFQLGETYGRVMYLDRVPKHLKTTFISDLADIQSNMLISLTHETTSQEEALNLAKYRLADIDATIANKLKNYAEEGYLGASLPPELEKAQGNARELIQDITSRNQKVFFMTMTLAIFADSKEELNEVTKQVKSIARKHLCPFKPVYDQQEFALNTVLPLCRNDLFVDIMYTTESAAVFIPYNSQEINQKNAIFYGLNQTTRGMILCDRLSGNNYNALYFGAPGGGKSFIAKIEQVSVLLNHPDAQIFVIDPQGEYYPMAQHLNGSRIVLAPGSHYYINPLDLDLASDDEMEIDPITMKTDFVFSMLETMLGRGRRLDPTCYSIVDRCVRKLYRPYIDIMSKRTDGVTCDPTICPTLADLYQELLNQENINADQLAEVLEVYAKGSFNTFAHRTNIKTQARYVVYDIKGLGSRLKDLGLQICTNDVYNRMISNSRANIYTWFFIDEFHILLQSPTIVTFLAQIWKMARKWMGVPTGILQNTEDLLRDKETRSIVNNTSFAIMMSSSLMDRQNLAELFMLSDSQLSYINNSEPGHGLLYNGKITLPFVYKFPKNTELYALMTTAHDVENAAFA